MLNDFDLDDILPGITPANAAADGPHQVEPAGDKPAHHEPKPAPLVPRSMIARVLFEVWNGARVVVVDSPPGAGKSTTVATVVAHLVNRAKLNVTVATPTKHQAASIANTIARQLDPSRIEVAVKDLPPSWLTPGLHNGKRPYTDAKVTVRTIASCRMSAPKTDLIVIDEAYQATFADVAAAANDAPQILLVGDPGQIGPVVTVDTTAWEHLRAAPHRRAPEVFSRREDAERLSIGKTYRLGPLTAKAIAPLYDFAFASARPDRVLVGRGGCIYDEIEALLVPASGSHDDLATLTAVVERAASLVGAVHVDLPGTAEESELVLQPCDIAVVVSRNSQASIITGLLSSREMDGIAVGTADRLQGGEWAAVVALDPATGYTEASDHALSLGRLCVMASRHTTHLSWVHDGEWAELLRAEDVPNGTAKRGLAVRKALTANEVTSDSPTQIRPNEHRET